MYDPLSERDLGYEISKTIAYLNLLTDVFTAKGDAKSVTLCNEIYN